ncbi:MAG: hypothetical protein EXR79_14395 [Myxococcales bacterium]|nr:hypothetical protein [Myxococcales bacterium]
MPAAEVKVPIIGITVEAYCVAKINPGSTQLLYSSLHIHSLTFESSYEAANATQTVAKLSQGDCQWAAERYGGRRLQAGGTLFGPKRNIAALGCGLTSARSISQSGSTRSMPSTSTSRTRTRIVDCLSRAVAHPRSVDGRPPRVKGFSGREGCAVSSDGAPLGLAHRMALAASLNSNTARAQ